MFIDGIIRAVAVRYNQHGSRLIKIKTGPFKPKSHVSNTIMVAYFHRNENDLSHLP